MNLVGKATREGVTSLDFWRKINVTKADEMVNFYQDAMQNAHGLVNKQNSEIQRLRKLLEERGPLQEEVTAPLKVAACGDAEGKNALAILPEEMWRIILEGYVHTEDLYSCYLSCTLFNKILEPTKTHWIMSKIFNLVYHHLEKSDILNCRATCKQWMTTIDHRIDQPAVGDTSTYNSIQNFFKGVHNGFPPPFALYNFPSSTNHNSPFDHMPVRKFKNTMRLHPRNPFLGRAVSIFEFSTTVPTFVNKTLEFLEKCGRHILYLMISTPRDQQPPTTCTNFLIVLNQSLAETPHLKTLHLNLWDLPTKGCMLILPKLCCPTSLQTLIVYNLPESCTYKKEIDMFADALVSPVSQQLVCLDFVCWSKRLTTFQWPNLKELIIRSVSKDTLVGLLEITLPKLKSLQLIFSPSDENFIPQLFNHLLKITNHFPELSSLELGHLKSLICTLENLEKNSPLSPGLYAPAKLSTLKVLNHVFQVPSWNSFLLRFPGLKYFYIDNDHAWEPEKYWAWYPTGIPIFLSMGYEDNYYLEDVLSAPIWKLLPSLQLLVYRYTDNPQQNCAYTKQGHMFRGIYANRFVDPSDGENEFDDDDHAY